MWNPRSPPQGLRGTGYILWPPVREEVGTLVGGVHAPAGSPSWTPELGLSPLCTQQPSQLRVTPADTPCSHALPTSPPGPSGDRGDF